MLYFSIHVGSYNEHNIKIKTSGFVLRYKNKNYIVTLHQNLPIIDIELLNNNIIQVTKFDKSNILINSCWSNILIMLSKNIHNFNIYSKYQNKLPSENDTLIIYDNMRKINILFLTITFISFNKLLDILTPYIIASFDEDLVKYIGYPVFVSDRIIGILSEIDNQEKKAYIIPIYIVIKNLLKKNNMNIYTIDVNFDLDNIKINNHLLNKNDIQSQDILNRYNIYHKTLGIYIPLNTFFLLEGDISNSINLSLNIRNNYNKILITFIEKKLDISNEEDIINDKGKYKINSRLIYLLKLYYMNNLISENTLQTINNNIENNIMWISI